MHGTARLKGSEGAPESPGCDASETFTTVRPEISSGLSGLCGIDQHKQRFWHLAEAGHGQSLQSSMRGSLTLVNATPTHRSVVTGVGGSLSTTYSPKLVSMCECVRTTESHAGYEDSTGASPCPTPAHWTPACSSPRWPWEATVGEWRE